MEKSPKISIIVPVYNVEHLLADCIDSILAQTFTEFELLLINDGSQDRSGEICDSYAAKDSRIKVVHKENSGQADSRNIAMKMARAELIGFVDSDDWIEPDMYEMLYNNLIENNADISICGHYLSYKTFEIPSSDSTQVNIYDRDSALKMIIDDKKIKSYLPDKLYRKRVITAELPKSFYYEDYATLFKWFANAERVVMCGLPKYHYRQRLGSTDHNANPRNKYHFFLAEKERYSYLKANEIFPEQHGKYAARLIRCGLREIKNIARKGISHHPDAMQYVELIKTDMCAILPVKLKHLGLMRWILLQLFLHAPSVYFRLITIGSSSAEKRKARHSADLY